MTRRKRLRFQNRVLVLVLLSVVPGWAGTVVLLYLSSATPALRWTIIGFLTFFVLIGLVAVRRHVVRPLQTLANMLEALREGDYSMRGRNVDPEDAFGEVMVEVNTLSRTLYDQRLEALEAGALLQKIIADVDIAVFAFDMPHCACASSTKPARRCSAERSRRCRAAAPPSSASTRCSPSRRAASWRTCFRAAAAGGRFAAAASARAASRTSCS